MKKLSKLLALLLSLLMILSLFAACGDDKKDDDDKDDTSVSDEKDKDDKDEDEDEDKDDKKDKDNKKDEEEEAISAEDMLIGEWETSVDTGAGAYLDLSLIFEDDGTAYFYLTKKSYDKMMDEIILTQMADVTDEEIEAEGFASREEAEEFVREMLEEEMPYEDTAAEFEDDFTWELDGDTLTIETDDGGISTAETKLSKGKTTFTLVDEDGGAELDFTKIN